jgi:hypothetical protein
MKKAARGLATGCWLGRALTVNVRAGVPLSAPALDVVLVPA